MENFESSCVLNYGDLRAFLKDYVHYRKTNTSGWSISEWAKQLNLEAAASITMIINGQRNCGKNIENALINYFQFSEKEILHFKILVSKEKLSKQSPIRKILESEVHLNKNKRPQLKLAEEQMAKISRWYFFTLRQLGRLIPLERSQSALEKVIKGSDDINFVEAIDTLVEQGLMHEKDGKYISTDVVLTTSQNISSEAIKKYHEEMGGLGVRAIRSFDVKKRNFQACTLSVSEDSLQMAHELIEKFINDFECLIDSQPASSVYQLNVQFFPLAVLNEDSFTST